MKERLAQIEGHLVAALALLRAGQARYEIVGAKKLLEGLNGIASAGPVARIERHLLTATGLLRDGPAKEQIAAAKKLLEEIELGNETERGDETDQDFAPDVLRALAVAFAPHTGTQTAARVARRSREELRLTLEAAERAYALAQQRLLKQAMGWRRSEAWKATADLCVTLKKNLKVAREAARIGTSRLEQAETAHQDALNLWARLRQMKLVIAEWKIEMRATDEENDRLRAEVKRLTETGSKP